MNRRSIGTFLRLFPPGIRRAFRWALVASVLLSLLDLGALIVLYPVFAMLLSSGAPQPTVAPGFLSGLPAHALVTIAVGAMLARSACGFGFRVWWSGQVAHAEVRLSSRLFAAYAYAPYAFHLSRNSADLLARAVAHVNLATAKGLNGLVLLATDATTALAIGLALILASPVAAGVVGGYLAIVGLVFGLVSRRLVVAQTQRFATEVAHVYRRATTVLRGIRELTVSGGRDAVLGSIDRSRAKMVRAQRLMFVLGDLPQLIMEVAFYGALLVALLLILGSGNPTRSLPVLALYVMAGLRILPAIARALGNLAQARAGIDMALQVGVELGEIEATTSEPEARPRRHVPLRAELALRDVAFGYDSGPLVLDGVDLALPFGTYAVVIGPSGAGKSTLLSLVLGLLSPIGGSVTYDDAPIGLADPAWLRHLAYVPQDVFVLDDTVLRNVAFGDVPVSAERTWAALERACLAEVVRAMPDGLDTGLGEAGSRLSAGQRQRLGIARALYREPSVLVLDEPTAALDRATEASVMDTIDALRGSVTTILVTHRLENAKAADMIVRLDGGRLETITPPGQRVVGSLERAR